MYCTKRGVKIKEKNFLMRIKLLYHEDKMFKITCLVPEGSDKC